MPTQPDLAPVPVPTNWHVEVYEHAEHWTFEITVHAVSSIAAIASARKSLGRGYSIKGAYRA